MDTEGVPILGLLRSLEPRYPTALVSQIRDKHNRPTDTAGPAESSQNLSGSVNTTTTSSTTVVVGSSTNPTENSSPHSPTPTPNKPHLRVMRIHESKGVSRHTDCPYGTTGNSPIVGATNPTVPPTRSRPKWLYHNPEKNSREGGPTAQSHTTTNYGSNHGDLPTLTPSIEWSAIETRLQLRYNSHTITCCPSGPHPAHFPTDSILRVARSPCLEILIVRVGSVVRPSKLSNQPPEPIRVVGPLLDTHNRRPFESPLGPRTTPNCRGHCSRQ
jgi:hypothetical protein